MKSWVGFPGMALDLAIRNSTSFAIRSNTHGHRSPVPESMRRHSTCACLYALFVPCLQEEMENRKNEFAKLWEEYTQVVLQVKQMEERDTATSNA